MEFSTSAQPEFRSDVAVPDDFTVEYLVHNRFLPLQRVAGGVRVAAVGALAADIVEDLELLYESAVELVEVGEDQLVAAIRRAFADAQSVDGLIAELGSTAGAEVSESRLEADARDLANQPPVIRFVNLLIKKAHAARASDIHLESGESGLAVRLRIDGALVHAPTPPIQIERAIVSRIKLLAELDIAEKRTPQDGRFTVRL